MGTSELFQLQGQMQKITRSMEACPQEASSQTVAFIDGCIHQLVALEDEYFRIALGLGKEPKRIAQRIRHGVVELMWLPHPSTAFDGAMDLLRKALCQTPPTQSPLAIMSARAFSLLEKVPF
jgi:hypothetical protein